MSGTRVLIVGVNDAWRIAVMHLPVGLGAMLLLFCLMWLWPALRTALARPSQSPMGQRTVLAGSIVGAIFAAIVLAVLRRGDHLPILYYVGYASLGYTPVVYMYMNLGNWLFGNVAAREFGQSAGLTIALMMLYIH